LKQNNCHLKGERKFLGNVLNKVGYSLTEVTILSMPGK
jgi:hypothetical protein